MSESKQAIIATPNKEQMKSIADVCNACQVNCVCVETFEQLFDQVKESSYVFLIVSDLMSEQNLLEQLLLIRDRTLYKFLPIIALYTKSPDYQNKKIKQLLTAPFDILEYPIHPELLRCKIQLFLTLDHQKNALEFESKQVSISKAAKKEFFGNITHELRTPLSSIIGMSELLSSSDSITEHKNYANNIRRSGELLLSMINTIIDYSKIKSNSITIRPKPFQPRKVLKKIIGILSVKLQAKHSEILQNIDPKIPDVILGDSSRFEQILFNMLNIAVQQTINNSLILNLFSKGKQDEQIKLYISIEDENMDLSELQLKTLQDNGFDADPNNSHIGIIVIRHIAKQLNGDMGFLKSEDNKTELWCTATFEKTSQDLGTCSVKSEDDIQDEPFVCTSLNPEDIRILLVEDNDINLILADKILKKNGFDQVDVARNGEEAVSSLTKKDYDLVIMDINMPVMDGLEASRQIRGRSDIRNPKVTIIALTANVSEEFKKECFDNGINDYLAKPFKKEKLIEMIKKFFPKIIFDKKENDNNNKISSIPKKSNIKSKKIPLFSKKALLERLEGDEALYQELMQGFLADIPVQINKLEKALVFDDLETAGQLAHTLKGAFSSVGAQLLQNLANQLEEFIQEEKYDSIKKCIAQLKISIDQIQSYI